MQVVDSSGNVFGQGLEITDKNGKPKVPVINTDITIGTTAIVGGVVGQVLFQGAGNVVQESPNITWDNTNSIFTLTRLLGPTMRLNVQASNPSKLQFTQELSVGVPTEIGFISNQFGTGMILQSYNSIYFNPGNVERMRFAPTTGNVLIGTTTDAGSKLQVKSSITNGTGTEAIRAYGISNYIGMHYDEGRGPVFITNYVGVGGNSPGSFNFYTSAGSVLASIGSGGVYSHNVNGKVSSGNNNGFINLWNGGSGDMELVLTTNHNITFSTNNIERLRITNAGNVGIGTTSPTSILDAVVSNGAKSGIRFRGYSDASTPYLLSLGTYTYSDIFQITSVNGLVSLNNTSLYALALGTNNTERLRITSTGNVLIGTTTDSGYKLDINGTARVVGSFIASAAIGAGSGSFALGTLATAASSTYGGALGYDAQSLNAHALAFGYSSRANGHSSVAIGRLAIANAADSVAFHNATSAGINSAAFGNGSTTTGTSSMATGSNAYTYLTGQLAVSGGSLNYKGDSQYSIYTGNLNTGIVNSGGTYSFAGIRPSNSTFGSDVTQIWYVECVVVFAVKGRTTAITEFALRDTYSIKYKLAVKSTNSLGTTILGTPVADSSFSDASMATTSVTFTIVSNNLVVNVTPPTWTSGGQMQFRGTASFGITELGVYGQPF